MAKFRSKLTARVLPVVFVGFAVSTGVAVASSAEAQRQAVADRGHDITANAAGIVETQTYGPQQAVTTLAAVASGFTGTDRSILVNQVKSVARTAQGVSDAYLAYEPDRAPGGSDAAWAGRTGMSDTGRFFTVYLTDPEGGEPELAYYSEQELAVGVSHEWYTGPRATGRLTTSEPYVDPGNGVLMTSFSYPITDTAGRFVGAAGVDQPLGDISERIGATKVGETGYAMLLSRDGILMAAPPGTVAGEDVLGYRTLAEAVADPDRRAAATEILRRSRGATGGSITDKDPFGSDDALITWTRVPSTGWTLVTVIPTDEIRQPVIALQVKLVLTALLVLATVAAALVWAAARLTRPLPRVRDAALQIAGGRLDVELPKGDDDELGEVSDAFAQIVAYLRGANETKNRFAQIQALADADPLTSVANRRRFFELADAAVAGSVLGAGPVGVLMIDIDHFKSINDTYGHATGDEVIVAVSQRLSDGLRAGDIIGRYGGEEFAVVLPGTDLDDSLAERLRALVADAPIPTRSGPLHVTISVGTATVAPGDTGISESMARADEALYRAKQAGRNRVMAAG